MTTVSGYNFMWGLNNSVYPFLSLQDLMKQRPNVKSATQAFVIGSTTPGQPNPEFGLCIDDMKVWTKSGRELRISMGGSQGPYLQDTCTLDQQKSIVDRFLEVGTTWLDIDCEGAYIGMPKVLNDMKEVFIYAKSKGLKTSITLAVEAPSQWGSGGLPQAQIDFIKSCPFKFDIVNLMAMDYYSNNVVNKMGQTACDISEVVLGQLKLIDATYDYQNIGLTPMIGRNDDNSIFTLDDAKIVTEYCKQKGIGLLSWWGLQRDNGSKGGLPVASMLDQEKFAFLDTFIQAQSDTPVTNIPTPPTTTPAPSVPSGTSLTWNGVTFDYTLEQKSLTLTKTD